MTEKKPSLIRKLDALLTKYESGVQNPMDAVIASFLRDELRALDSIVGKMDEIHTKEIVIIRNGFEEKYGKTIASRAPG
jgi:hypothetical protein